MEVSAQLKAILLPTPKSELARREHAQAVSRCVRSNAHNEVPEGLADPISQFAFEKPVRIEGDKSHQAFDAIELRKWDSTGNGLHPITRAPLKGAKLVDAPDVRSGLAAFYLHTGVRLLELGSGHRAARVFQKAITLKECTLTEADLAPLCGVVPPTGTEQLQGTLTRVISVLATWEVQKVGMIMLAASSPQLGIQYGLPALIDAANQVETQLRAQLNNVDVGAPEFGTQLEELDRLSGNLRDCTNRLGAACETVLRDMGMDALVDNLLGRGLA